MSFRRRYPVCFEIKFRWNVVYRLQGCAEEDVLRFLTFDLQGVGGGTGRNPLTRGESLQLNLVRYQKRKGVFI